jgi:diketogulonate reductase-like aldo/keto reductase
MTKVPLTPQGIPLLGMGTWPLAGEECIRTIQMALEVGFRHIDTAQMYGNERETGEAIAGSGVKRGDLFIVTKVAPENLFPRSRFLDSVKRSLGLLKLAQVDLLLIHWPPRNDFNEAIAYLNEALGKGLTRLIGVSNFTIAQMHKAQELSGGRLVTNQVEFQPLLDQSRLREEAEELGMCLSAYSPMGRGIVLKEPVIAAIADRLGRPPSEIALRWIVQQGVVAIPMTTKRENAASNLRIFDFELSGADMAAITALTFQNRRLVSPGAWAPQWD